MKAVISVLYRLLGWGLILALLLSYLSPYINPNRFWIPGILGLTFYAWFVGALLYFLAGVFTRLKIHWYLGAVILLGLFFLPRHLGWSSRNTIDESHLKVVSFNTWGFGHIKEHYTSKEIEKLFVEKDVDIAVFQEWRRNRNEISKKLYPYSKVFRHSINSGVEILSRHKIVDAGKIDLPETDSDAGYADIVYEGDTIRFYALHLESHRLTPSDYHRIKGLKLQDSFYQKQAIGILGRLRYAMRKQSEQADIIKDHMSACPHPIFVCADMNNTSMSYAYQSIKGRKKDAFMEKGYGFGATYLKPFPLLRIDYILHDDYFKCTSFETMEGIVSDHKLIFASFSKTTNP